MLIKLIVPGEHARVEDLNASLEAVLSRHCVVRGVRDDVRLIVEELASNVIEHGGTDVPTGQRELSVDIGIDGDRLSLQFSDDRSEEHTSELQSLMRISYAVFCLQKKKKQ